MFCRYWGVYEGFREESGMVLVGFYNIKSKDLEMEEGGR